MTNSFGNFLYELRKEKGWSQAELAERLGRANTAVSKWESGETLPGTELWTPLAKLFDITVDELLNGRRSVSAAIEPAPEPSDVPAAYGTPIVPQAPGGAPPRAAKRKRPFILVGAAAGFVAVVAVVLVSVLAATAGTRAENKYVRENTVELTYTLIDESGSALPAKTLRYVYGRTTPELDLSDITVRAGYELTLYTSPTDTSQAAQFDPGQKPGSRQVEIWARWAPITYSVTFANLLTGTNPNDISGYTVESDTITFELPGGRNGFTGTWDVLSIPKGTTGNITVTAVWIPASSGAIYAIAYANLSYPGVENPNAYTVYTVENETITFAPPTRPGYIGTWDILSIPEGSTDHKTITAVWTPVQYTITYTNLDFSQTSNPNAAVTAYTVESAAIILAAPTRPGYTGAWTTAYIPQGSTGDKTVTAVWTPVVYTISYVNVLNGTNPHAGTTSYTIESETIMFTAPTRTGYTGAWNRESVPKGSTGNITVTASWTAVVYTVTYANLLNGTNPNAGVTTYTVESDAFAFAAPARIGYTGAWDRASVPKGSTGNITVTASWTALVYTVTYANLLNGTNPNAGVTTYTIESDTVSFTAPARTGYTGAWDTLEIPKGSVGNQTVTAVWTANQYTVTYVLRGGESAAESARVTFDGDYTLAVPAARAYCTFDGWRSAVFNGIKYTDNAGASLVPWTIANDVTVYAYWMGLDNLGWALAGNSYTVSKGAASQPVLAVPAEYEGYPVTAVGSFANYSALTSVMLPASVVSVASSAFEDCVNLENVLFEKGSLCETIGSYAFRRTGLKSIVLPGKVTSFESAFRGCDGFETVSVEENSELYYGAGNCIVRYADHTLVFGGGGGVTVPASAARIGNSAFYTRIRLESIAFEPGGVLDSVGGAAFYNCVNLAAVTLPDTVTSVENNAFTNCTSLAAVMLSDSLLSIGNGAFSYCEALASIEFPDSVTFIGSNAFYYCTALLELTLPANLVSVGNSAFDRCRALKSVTAAGNQLKTIGDFAFYECSELVSVILPDSIERMGWMAFRICLKLAVMVLPFAGAEKFGTENTHFGYIFGAPGASDNRTYIPPSIKSVTITADGGVGDSAFRNCQNITSITLGESITSIGNYAFESCYSLTEMEVPPGVASIGTNAFQLCRDLTKVTLPPGLKSIAGAMFLYCRQLTNVEIPESVESIGYSAFGYCQSFTSITIPKAVTSIGPTAFNNCREAESLNFAPDNKLTSIGAEAFRECVKLTDVAIPHGVTSVVGAFYWCSGLKSVALPPTVTNIESAFNGCRALESVVMSPNITSITGAFQNCPALTAIVIPEGVTGIGNNTFGGCSSLTSVTIPKDVTGLLGDSVFAGCSGLTSVTIPKGVTGLGTYAFSGCSGLKSVTFEEGSALTAIGASAFAGCSGLTRMTVPAGVTSVGGNAFNGCTNLVSAVFGRSGRLSLGSNAFSYCGSLSSVTLPEYVGFGYNNASVFSNSGSVTLYYERSPLPADWPRQPQLWSPSGMPLLWGCALAEENDGLYVESWKKTAAYGDNACTLYNYNGLAISAPYRQGYTFGGWAASPGGAAVTTAGGIQTYSNNNMAIGATLYAIWIPMA